MMIRKRYVDVDVHFDSSGNVRPKYIYWDEGKKYEVEHVYDVREAASTKAGGQGLRFTVRVLNKETYIYYENPAWFVEEKVY